MEIKRFDTLTEAATGAPLIEIRDAGEGRFLLSITLSDDEATHLQGPYPSADVAEREGVAIAEDEGVELLHVVHTVG